MAVLQTLTVGPLAWAAPALAVGEVRVSPVQPPVKKGPEPDAALLARQASLITGLTPVDRPTSIPKLPPPKLAAEGTERWVSQLSALPVRPAAFEETSEEANRAVGAMLISIRKKTEPEKLSALAAFLEQNPETPWRISLLASLGRMELQSGYFTRAFNHLSEAWRGARNSQQPAQQRVTSEIAGDLALVLARMGKTLEFTNFLEEAKGQPRLGLTAQKIIEAEALYLPRVKGIANARGGCAVASLRTWHSTLFGHFRKMPLVLLDTVEQQKIGDQPRADQATTLKQLSALANAAGWDSRMVKRNGDSPLPTPAIVHWKHGHYALVLGHKDGNYMVEDKALGGTLMVPQEAMDEETSGYALSLSKTVPNGATEIGAEEASQITGFTVPETSNPEKDSADECENGEAAGKCCGMPGYWFDKKEGTLKIKDTPLFDDPGVGPALMATLRYAHRSSNNLATVGETTGFATWVGQNWTLTSLSAVVTSGGMWVADAEAQGWDYKEMCSIFLPSGGRETYSLFIDSDSNPGDDNMPFSSRRHFQTKSTLDKQTYTVTGGTDLTTKFIRTTPDKTQYHFEVNVAFLRDNNATSSSAAPVPGGSGVLNTGNGPFFLSKIVQPNGMETKFHYDYDFSTAYYFRLGSVEGPSGNYMILQYEDGIYPNRVTGIYAGNRGQTYKAVLGYDEYDRLTSITDAIGLESTFAYDGFSSDITSMTTPYGTTDFEISEPSGTQVILQATDPLGGKERMELDLAAKNEVPDTDASVPAGIAVRNASLNKRNTYYWSKRAMQEMDQMRENEELDENEWDYSLAHITHWLVDPGADSITRVPHSTKAPLEGRVWYEYEGQADVNGDVLTSVVGTSTQPMRIARVLDDATTQLREFEYNANGNTTESTDPVGRVTKYTYDGSDRLTAIKQVNGMSDEVQAAFSNFHASRQAQTITDAAGQVTTVTYDNDGDILTATRTRNSQSETTTNVYYANNDPMGSAGQLKERRGPSNELLASYTYDSLGRLATVTNADGYRVRLAYDMFDRPLFRIFPDGTYEQSIYNKLDVEWQRDRQGRWTRTQHDSRQAVTAVTDPSGRTTTFDWCICGALDAIIDAEQQTTTFLRDVQGRVTDKVYADSTALQYVYETRTSRTKEMKQPRTVSFTAVTEYEYFKDDTLKKVSYVDGSGTSLMQSRADGTKIDAPVEFTYDSEYRRVATMIDGTGTTTYAYHPVNSTTAPLGDGRLSSVDGPMGNDTITYAYDEFGRVTTRQINGSANSATRVFDALGRMDSETNVLGTFDYAYAGNTGRLTDVSNGQGFRMAYEYYPNVPETSGTGNGDRRLKAIKHYRSTNTLDAQHDYVYTQAGNISRWTQRWADLSAGKDYTLRYDAADQLIGSELRNVTNGVLEREEAWGYDSVGNRELAQASIRDGMGNYSVEMTRSSHNNLNQMTSQTGGGGALRFEGTSNEPATVTVGGQRAEVRANPGGSGYLWSAEKTLSSGSNAVNVSATDANSNVTSKTANVTSSGMSISSLTYDLAGNLLSDGAKTYEWDAANRLVQINYTGQGQAKTEITYDGRGRRVRMTEKNNAGSVSSVQRFLWDGGALVDERDSTGSTVNIRFFERGEQKSVTTFLYRRDHLGSIRETSNSAGSMQSRVDYDLWGERTVLSGVGASESSFAFTGHYWHARTNLNMALYRSYSAEMGRWLNRDPIAEHGGINVYCYVENNPMNRVDLLGLIGMQVQLTMAVSEAAAAGMSAADIAATFGLTLAAAEALVKAEEKAKRCRELKLEKKAAKNATDKMGGCDKNMSCEDLKDRVEAWQRHSDARWNYSKECFCPTDPEWRGHEIQQQQVQVAADKCKKMFKEKGCPP